MNNASPHTASTAPARAAAFLRARYANELPPGGQRALFYGWNAAALLLSSAALCTFSLLLAIGNYDWAEFFGYYKHFVIFLLNWLPILLVQLLLLCLFNRQWAAYLGAAVLFLLPSLGNYYKLRVRYEPFVFRDISSITTALHVAGNYDLSPNKRILLVLIAVPTLLVLIALLARGRLSGRLRLGAAVLALLPVFPLWRFVYSSTAIYDRNTNRNNNIGIITAQERFVNLGFVYPFLYSITESKDIPPEGYDAERAAAVLAAYEDADIPADRRVNLLVVQLESFTDLEAMGLQGVAPETYEVLRALQAESITGTMVANVIGGGTIDTERCLLSGSYGMMDYTHNAPSYVRYFNGQGYFTTGSHPNKADFYNRLSINSYLGFDEYLFTNNHYAALVDGEWDWMCDDVFIPEIFRLFKEHEREGSVFSFNVSLQGHSPYERGSLVFDELYWEGEGASELTRNVINNYLGSLADTQRRLMPELEALRTDAEPAVVLLYGDHNPWLETRSVYEEAGIPLDQSSAEGLIRYYGTPYLIWANDAAKALLGRDFTGEGPTVSPGYLLNVVFRELGWTGSAFMQYTDGILDTLPVVSTNGFFVENGRPVTALDDEGRRLLQEYGCEQFWLRGSMK
ncbi:MAG: LTA synthase family protein [Oscillospiraceae bacterium]|nr:LTA synthase family protein [Oscillospiraceae bacterium]